MKLSVDELVEQIELDASVTVIAESFSGAVGIRLAAKHPALVEKLVLVGSFVTPPCGSGLLRPFGTAPFQIIPPRFALRQLLAGDDASEELMDELEAALRQVAPEVLAHRLAAISRIDERATLRSLTMPITVLSAKQDRLVSRALTAEVLASAPGALHLELEGPHLLLQSRPGEAAAILRASWNSRDAEKNEEPRASPARAHGEEPPPLRSTRARIRSNPDSAGLGRSEGRLDGSKQRRNGCAAHSS